MELLNPSCHNSKIPWPKASLKSPNRMTLLQACLHRLWVAKTPKLKGMWEAELNDCQSMQFIPRLDLSTQIQVLVLHHSLDQGLNQPTKPIPMRTHAALATTLLSSHSPLGVWMCVHMTNPSNHCRMHRLCLAPLPGMIQQLGKLAFWSSMKHFIAAPNQITP